MSISLISLATVLFFPLHQKKVTHFASPNPEPYLTAISFLSGNNTMTHCAPRLATISRTAFPFVSSRYP
ncbi:hypothetical protein FRC19_005067 [Serendipita sp. 401]|nr:hypothetical protein FRC19_005067 [Serendipita sp. 401]